MYFDTFRRTIRNQLLGEGQVIEEGGTADSITYLTDEQRTIFLIIYIIILVVAIGGNSAAIVITLRRKHRFIQKTCIISLSLSDLTTVLIYSINNLETFSHPLVNWTLGSFMCSFVPMIQVLGITASTCAMVIIAIDRYRNVVHALVKKWDPKPSECIIAFVILWLFCLSISYPISTVFVQRSAHIVFYNETGHFERWERLYFCFCEYKNELMIYYICICVLIFLTLFIIFTWLYFKIAKLVWKHRKPPNHHSKNNDSSMTVETSTTQIKSTDTVRNVLHRPNLAAPKSIHVERKIRTFKIIISLMVIFFVCRLPFWLFNILKLTTENEDNKDWIITYCFNILALINCAINPFLYTFLNPTLNFLIKLRRIISDFICNVCCCCCSNTEFDEFERENPFIADSYEKKKYVEEPQAGSSNRNSRVKFEDIAHIQIYQDENNLQKIERRETKKY